MDVHYLADKSDEFILLVWKVVENMHENPDFRHYEIGWWGFTPMLITH